MYIKCQLCNDDGFITDQEGITVCECTMKGGVNYEGGGYEEEDDENLMGGALVLANK